MNNYIVSRYFSFTRNESTGLCDISANWSYIESVPEFAMLKTTPQSPKWHSEGAFVMDHVKLCVDYAISYFTKPINSARFNDDTILVVLMAVLFHDIGKGRATVLGDDGLYHNPNHATVGEKITRRLLWDLGYYKREYICNLVKYHMHPLDVIKKKDWFERMHDLSCKCGGLRELALLKMFDLQGSKPTVEGAIEHDYDSINKFINAAKYLDIYDSKPAIGPNTNLNKFCASDNVVTVYVLLGLPGAGKSTYVDRYLSGDGYVHISRDEIRHELGYCGKDEKFIGDKEQEKLVTERFEQKMIEAAEQGKILVLDNMNNRREYRDSYKKILKGYDTRWKYVYCEAPTLDINIMRRHGQIDGDLFGGMIDHFDMPSYEEYESLRINITRD